MRQTTTFEIEREDYNKFKEIARQNERSIRAQLRYLVVQEIRRVEDGQQQA